MKIGKRIAREMFGWLTCMAWMSFSSLRFCAEKDDAEADSSETRSEASCSSLSAILRARSAASTWALSSSISPARTIARRSDAWCCSRASSRERCSDSIVCKQPPHTRRQRTVSVVGRERGTRGPRPPQFSKQT